MRAHAHTHTPTSRRCLESRVNSQRTKTKPIYEEIEIVLHVGILPLVPTQIQRFTFDATSVQVHSADTRHSQKINSAHICAGTLGGEHVVGVFKFLLYLLMAATGTQVAFIVL